MAQMFLSADLRTRLRLTFSTKHSKTLKFVSVVNEATTRRSFNWNIGKRNKCKKLKVSTIIHVGMFVIIKLTCTCS